MACQEGMLTQHGKPVRGEGCRPFTGAAGRMAKDGVAERLVVPRRPVNADVALAYDSSGRTVEEARTYGGNTRFVTSTRFSSLPATQFEIPNNRLANNGFDALYHKTGLAEQRTGGNMMDWTYFGTGRGNEAVGCVQTQGRASDQVLDLSFSRINSARAALRMSPSTARPISRCKWAGCVRRKSMLTVLISRPATRFIATPSRRWDRK